MPDEILPSEIKIRFIIIGDINEVYLLGGTAIEGPRTEIEVMTMRGDVLVRMPVPEIAGWIDRCSYRYVPGTRAMYHREARVRAPVQEPIVDAAAE
jgi:hypothetical protein